jgi:hypothetical protein
VERAGGNSLRGSCGWPKTDALGRVRDAVAKKLIESLTGKYNQHLEAAASAFSANDHSQEVLSASDLIARIEALIFSNIISQDNRVVAFERLIDVYGTWAHFTSNEGDAKLRSIEQCLLRKLLDAAGDNWRRYPTKLKTSDVFEKRGYKEFVYSARSRFTERACQAALELFGAKDGALKFIKGQTPELSQALVLDPQSALWTGDAGAAKIERLLQDGSRQPEIQRNAPHFLDMASGRHG